MPTSSAFDIILIRHDLCPLPEELLLRLNNIRQREGRLFIYFHQHTLVEQVPPESIRRQNNVYVMSGPSDGGNVLKALKRIACIPSCSTGNFLENDRKIYLKSLYGMFKEFKDRFPSLSPACPVSFNTLEEIFDGKQKADIGQIASLYLKI